MPLQAGDLDQHLVVVPPGQTVGQALDELKNRGGDDTWSLFVPWLDGTWGVLEAGELRSFLAELGAALFGRTLGELWERVPEALAVQDSIGIGAAEEQALRQPKGALLVLHGQDVAGRFYRGTHRASARPSIGDLYAGYLATPADRRSTWTPKGADPASHEGEETVLPVDMPTSKPAPSAAESYVSTGFVRGEAAFARLDPTTPLACGRHYFFWLSVGEIEPGTIDTEHIRLEVERFPAGARFAVVLFSFENELELTPGASVGVLRLEEGQVVVDRQPAVAVPGLDPAGPDLAKRLYFPVRAPARPGTFRLRCNLYYNQVLIQSRLVHARVMRRPKPVERALRTDLDYRLADRPTSPPVARIPAHRLSLMVNSSGDGMHNVRFFGGDPQQPFTRDVSLDEHQVQSLIDDARGSLRRACWGDTGPWTGAPGQAYRYGAGGQPALAQLTADLLSMAVSGFNMYDTFARELVGALPHVQELRQLMRAPGSVEIALKGSSRFVLPAALFYDCPHFDTNLAPSDYRLCPEFVRALGDSTPLEEQACFLGNCPSQDEEDVVCPSGFWGFRHQIGLPLSEGQGSEVAPEIEYQGMPTLTVCVSTDPNLPERQPHVQAIQGLLPGMGWHYADSRNATFEALRQEADLVYFYCHGGVYGANKPYLSVGPATERGITPPNLGAKEIYWTDPRPLVVINGCHTVDVEPEVALNFVDAFVRTSRASGVIGTEITIFEPLARAFGEGFLRRFLAGMPLGEAVRSVRLAMLKAGNPLGLVYIPFALPSLRLERKAGPA